MVLPTLLIPKFGCLNALKKPKRLLLQAPQGHLQHALQGQVPIPRARRQDGVPSSVPQSRLHQPVHGIRRGRKTGEGRPLGATPCPKSCHPLGRVLGGPMERSGLRFKRPKLTSGSLSSENRMRHSGAQLCEIANEFVDYEARSLAVIQLECPERCGPFHGRLLSGELRNPRAVRLTSRPWLPGRAGVVWALPANDGLPLFPISPIGLHKRQCNQKWRKPDSSRTVEEAQRCD